MALSADRVTACKSRGRFITLKMKASTTIYKGGMVSVDSSGLAIPAADTASTIVIGIAEEYVVSAASGNYYVKVSKGVFKLANSGSTAVVQATVGSNCVVEDDQTVGINTAQDIVAGKVDEIDADGGIWVAFL